jgi:hypothetical protein
VNRLLDGMGRLIARHLQKPVHGFEPFTPSDPEALRQSLEPGDVLLVEGNNNISGVIKYLTQSTWSHSALYVGPVLGCATEDGEPHVLVEANVGEGVVSGAALEIFPLSYPHLPAGRPDRAGLRAGVRLRGRAHRLRLRSEEYHRSDALSLAAAGAAALAPPLDRARLGRSVAADLLGADRGSVPRRPLSDPAEDHAHAQPAGDRANPGNPAFVALLPARLRHFPLFQRGKAHRRPRLRLLCTGPRRRRRRWRRSTPLPPAGAATRLRPDRHLFLPGRIFTSAILRRISCWKTQPGP